MLNKKAIWQGVMVVLTVLGPLFFWYFWQKENKHLSFVVDSNISIISLGEDRIDGVDLYYKDKKIESLSVVEATLLNDGNAPIKPDDFSKPLQVIFNGDIVSDPVVMEVNPKQLNPKFVVLRSNIFELEPLLLNPGDAIKVRFNISNLKSNEIDIQGRVVGISQLLVSVKNTESVLNYKKIAIIETCILGFAFVVFLVSIVVDYYFYKKEENKRRCLYANAMLQGKYTEAHGYARTPEEFETLLALERNVLKDS